MSITCQWQRYHCSFLSSPKITDPCKRIACTTRRSNFTAGTPVVLNKFRPCCRSCVRTVAPIAAATAMQIRVKLSVAASTDKLDLSNFGLQEVPDGVCNLTDLKVCLVASIALQTPSLLTMLQHCAYQIFAWGPPLLPLLLEVTRTKHFNY